MVGRPDQSFRVRPPTRVSTDSGSSKSQRCAGGYRIAPRGKPQVRSGSPLPRCLTAPEPRPFRLGARRHAPHGPTPPHTKLCFGATTSGRDYLLFGNFGSGDDSRAPGTSWTPSLPDIRIRWRSSDVDDHLRATTA